MTTTICLVDDNTDILGIFAIFFGKKGYNVIETTSGQECIDLIHLKPPDIILLDVMMEPMDGWMTLVQIKNNPSTRHIPVIMVSGKNPTTEELKIYGNLFVQYLMKPISFPQLYEAVAGVLERRASVKI
ncbi:MAG TPA: response regulator [Methanoregulaceae archaeon]|nr:response regulator [Methanoregulaceae archaeon]